MAGTIQENKSISKLNQGFPDYLDWEKLRAIGLDHLGKLSGRIWTDHNAHDPGITILEMLCYALMDLGYRTHLPVADIFARDPTDTSPENNFFTAPEILACNPVTVLDFRKLLIDIRGVRNAWLEDTFMECHKVGDKAVDEKETKCSDCYNGLYHVYIETEEEYDKTRHKPLEKKIRETLMAHRNLCEDFIDINFLCKKKVGLCADIELETTADGEEVYKNVVENLRNFFSPSPRFYTLHELLEKNRGIEDIYAGRPYDITESHGFVDTEEFEAIRLRREIHLSDIYNIILKVPGIRTVKNMALKSDCGTPGSKGSRDWKWQVPKNHVPDFSIGCSSFQFSRNGIVIPIDMAKFGDVLDIDFANRGKVQYKRPSPYLDVELPQGVYRADLGDYQSIQNEFPRVYGINRGGLASDAPKRRKAQAYQLKAYLLFFDQLLANYLSQLKNMRSLFAFKSPAKKQPRHTYFLNELKDVPELEKLVRFNGGKPDTVFPEDQGTVLAIPVNKEWLTKLIESDISKFRDCDLHFQPASFCDMVECDTAVINLQQDLFSGDVEYRTVSTSNECWFFYFYTSSENIAIVSNKFYKNETMAKQAADSIKFAATFRDNYRTFINSGNRYSFTLDLKINEYGQYLQRIMEDDTLYSERRQHFLDHLLSRFAERFTDFALLSFGFADEKKRIQNDIAQKEKFLSGYTALSSQRGKAYDYVLDGWNNENLSGLEKKVYSLAGMGDTQRKHLCNFVVEDLEEYYLLNLAFTKKQKLLFRSSEKYYSKDKALDAAKSLLTSLRNENNYDPEYHETCIGFKLKVKYDSDQPVLFNGNIPSATDAVTTRHGLYKLFSTEPTRDDVFVSKRLYEILIKDAQGNALAKRKVPFEDETSVLTYLQSLEYQLIFSGEYQTPGENPASLEGKYFGYIENGGFGVMFEDAFTIDTDNTIKGKPGKVLYKILDLSNSFKFTSVIEFENDDDARVGARQLLVYLNDPRNYYPVSDESGKYALQIIIGDELIAKTDPDYGSTTEAKNERERIIQHARRHRYTIGFSKFDHRWKFSYLLGYESDKQFLFSSKDDFISEQDALDNAVRYYKGTPGLVLQFPKASAELVAKVQGKQMICLHIPDKPISKDKPQQDLLGDLLEIRKEAYETAGTQSYEDFIISGNKQDRNYVYRLVDKDHLHASYIPYKGSGEDDAQKIRKKIYRQYAPYWYTEIGSSEDIIKEYKDDKKKTTRYHYCVQCINHRSAQEGMLGMFESVKGYDSREEALKVFNESYLLILSKAMDAGNYGAGKYISPVPVQEDKNDCEKAYPVVFIPEESIEAYKWNSKDIITELVDLAKKFPVRYITKEEDGFYNLFPCEIDKRIPGPTDCKTKNKGTKFYYFVLNNENAEVEWQSLRYYLTAVEALDRFHFFLLLLRYPGNYAVIQDFCDCKENKPSKPCTCHWKIVIREVLAESKKRFNKDRDSTTSTDAWSAVEKFICTSQSKAAFQAYLDQNSCAYTFDVSCSSLGLIHRCKYDTARMRDLARKELWKAYEEFKQRKLPVLLKAGNTYTLKDQEDKDLVKVTDIIPDSVRDYVCPADLFYELFRNLSNADKGIITIYAPDGAKIRTIEAPDSSIDFTVWMERLIWLSDRYPVVRRENGKYYIAIRLEEFGLCDEHRATQIERKKPDHFCSCCCVAWESECCFSTCGEAHAYLGEMKECLEDPCNYQRVFDCECGPYGIRLNCCGKKEQRVESTCCNEIIAVNPQWYLHPGMSCDAVARAKKLINAEGFHLIEHILLRPRCEQECTDLERCKIETCGNNHWINCEWEWKGTGEPDICLSSDTMPVNFDPNKDPYSFIATAILPSWPERFHKPENRAIIENLLYQETPAHILLRIVWVNPRQFCRLEHYFKQWISWTSRNFDNKCQTKNPACDLIRYLFEEEFNPLYECDECIPCKETEITPTSCFESEPVDCPTSEWDVTNTINKLFCWNGNKAPDPKPETYEDAEEEVVREEELYRQRETSADPFEEFILQRKVSVILEEEAPPKFLAKRINKNKRYVNDLLKELNGNDIVESAKRFVDSKSNEPEYLVEVVFLIQKNEKKNKSRGIKLSSEKQQELINHITHSFLDNLLFHGTEDSDIYERLEKAFKTLRKKGMDNVKVFESWYDIQLNDFKKSITSSHIASILTAKK